MRKKENNKTHGGLHKELGIVVLVKISLIYLIWVIFFSHPPGATLTGAKMANHLFSTPVKVVQKR